MPAGSSPRCRFPSPFHQGCRCLRRHTSPIRAKVVQVGRENQAGAADGVLYGRDGLIHDVTAMLGADRRGPIMIEGDAGMGKTALLRAILRRLPDGAVSGTGYRALDWQPYLPLRPLLGSTVPTSAHEAARLVRDRSQGRPVVIDDLHWADTGTLSCLDELMATTTVLVAARPGHRACAEVRGASERAGTLLALERLGDVDAERLVRDRHPGLGDVAVAGVVAGAHGNPLLLEVGPSATHEGVDRITAEVARTSVAARRLLARLALSASAPVECPAHEEVRELLAARLIEVDRCGRIRLRHDLFGRAAVDLLPERARQSLHHELAQAAADQGERARHLLAAGDRSGAQDAAAQAARQATTPEERAAHLLVSVEAAGDRVDDALLVEAAEASRAAYRLAEALDLVGRVGGDDADLVLRAAAVDAVAAWTEGDYGRAEAAIYRGLAVAEGAEPHPANDAHVIDLLCIDARLSARVRWDGERAAASADRALELAERSDQPLGPVLSVVATASLVHGTDRWRGALHEAIDRAAADDDLWTTFTAADTLFMAELMAGDPRRCRVEAESAIETAETLGIRRPVQQMTKNLLLARFHIHAELEPVVAEARALLAQPLHFRPREHLESTLAMAFADLGDFDAAEEVLHDAIGWQLDDPTSRAMVLWTRAEVDWSAGRLEATLDAGEECRQLAVSGFPAHVAVEPVRQWAALELGLDPGDPAGTPLFPNLAAAALESAAIVSLHRDPLDPANADRFLQAAEEWAGSLGRPVYRARLGAGEAARRAGDVSRAVEILEPLSCELRATGRLPLLRRALAALRQCGRRVHRPTPEPVPPFTGGEVEVLDLVGRGLDSRAIARRLGLTVETVESVVRSGRHRIGATTRTAAALALVRARSSAAASPRSEATVIEDDEVFDRFVSMTSGADGYVDLGLLPETPWDLRERGIVATGRVAVRAGHDRAVLAALRGCQLVLHVGGLEPGLRAELVDQLRRTETIDVIEAARPDPSGPTALVTDDIRIAVAHLGGGSSLNEVAHRLNTSVRTLHRRLASARAALGVETNRELVRRLGSD
jgi:DNA-binding NarL/FixJ family response regulator